MPYSQYIEIAGNWAAILTAGVATFAFGKYLFDKRARKEALEKYLKGEKSKGEDQGQRSIVHLVARLGMTEAQILEASFQSDKIARRVAADKETGRASDILLEWKGE
jgi:hypothetical protein